MNKRISEIIKHEGLSNKEFAQRVGIGESSVTHYTSGRNKPNQETIQKILQAFTDLNPDWLISGDLPMYKHEKAVQGELFPSMVQSMPKIETSAPQNQVENPVIAAPQPSQIVETQTIIKEVVREIPAKEIVRIVVYFSDNSYADFPAH